MHRRGVERVNCGPKLLDLGEKGVYSSYTLHGRYDVVCPIQNAFDLHKAWPKAELLVSATAGHSAFEAENAAALVEGTDRFAG